MSLYQDWNVFGHIRETGEHGGRTGGRSAFHGHDQPFENGVPVSLREMGAAFAAMGIDGESDDECLEGAGVSSEFYGTRMGDGSVRGALSPLSGRECVSCFDAEDVALANIDGTPADVLKRFMRSKHSRNLDLDDRNYIWSVIRECGECETAEQAEQLESLIETIERRLACQRTKAVAAAEIETPKVKTEAPKPVERKQSEAPKADGGERKSRRRGRRGGRNRHGKGKATKATPVAPVAKPERKPESRKDDGKRKAPRRHDGLVFVRGEHRGQVRYECRRGSRLFVWDRKLSGQPVDGKSYDCREVAVIAKGQLLILAVRPL